MSSFLPLCKPQALSGQLAVRTVLDEITGHFLSVLGLQFFLMPLPNGTCMENVQSNPVLEVCASFGETSGVIW